MMQDFANWALDTATARGASYADVRVMDHRARDLSTKNGHVGAIAMGVPAAPQRAGSQTLLSVEPRTLCATCNTSR